MSKSPVDTALVDVDGTLVDSNYQHALAWYRAFRRFDIVVPVWQVHRHIGMGGDQIVGALAGDEAEVRHGEALREAWTEEFEPMQEEIAALPGARDLLAALGDRGLKVVLASSGESQQIEHYLDLLDARAVVADWTTSKDVRQTKPAPDLLQVALDKVGGGSPVMIGDSTWDCVAAGRLQVASVAILTGGFSEQELTEAGAHSVFASVEELKDNLDRTPLAG